MKVSAFREVAAMLCDLHLHTTKSDGVLLPEQLFAEIRSRELAVFSITDHDCLDAYPVPEDLRSRVIPGLEVDSHHAGKTVHILAYGVGGKKTPLLAALAAQRADRRRRMQVMVDRLCANGIEVSIEDVAAQASQGTPLGRPHLARALVAKGHVSSVQQAFDRHISDEGAGYASLRRLTSREVIDLIHESGGVAVLAHPMRLAQTIAIEELILLGLDGIEILHPTASLEDVGNLRALARVNGLLMTGGTDFHAPVPGRPIGVDLPDSDIAALQERLFLEPAR